MIEAQELTRYYGDFLAVDKATFTIETGEIVGLLGPNAAGKTTIMKMLTTFLHPSSGTALVGGKDIISEPLEVRKIIGYLPETLPLYPAMEVREYLTFVAKARGLSGARLSERLKWVVKRCGLAPVFRQPISELSKGYRQRTGIAQALIHDPEIVILDEPTSGLDPHQVLDIRDLIEELAKERTVIISTHILQEMAAMTDRFIVIDKGAIVADGPLDSLREKVMKNGRLNFTVGEKEDVVKPVLKAIDQIKDFTSHEQDGKSCFIISYTKGFDLSNELNRLTVEKNWKLFELRENPYSLEQTFLALTQSEEERYQPVGSSAVEGEE